MSASRQSSSHAYRHLAWTENKDMCQPSANTTLWLSWLGVSSYYTKCDPSEAFAGSRLISWSLRLLWLSAMF